MPCPVEPGTQVVYSKASGVGGASVIWVEDFLWWLKSANPSLRYQGLVESEIQSCDFTAMNHLRLYINPGGNAYDQLSALGPKGSENIKAFVTRDQSAPSAYAGFCAGAYLASHDYLWETMYEGPGYYNFKQDPPLGLFPHTVEGSLVDLGDDQYADQFGHKYRTVNVSNGHRMVYFGGSSFGWNGTPDYGDKSSPAYDPDVEVQLYYSDFYGYSTYNLPAAWRYKNLFLTSIHAEADNCTQSKEKPRSADCPVASETTLGNEDILRNRDWLLQHLNKVAGTDWRAPAGTPPANMSIAKPHDGYPEKECGEGVLFCDDFDTKAGAVAAGLSVQWQRNQTRYNSPHPWNTTYISAWPGCAHPCTVGTRPNTRETVYGAAQAGNGYAVAVPQALHSAGHMPTITTRAIAVPTSGATLSFYTRGSTHGGVALGGDGNDAMPRAPRAIAGGSFIVSIASHPDGPWQELHASPLSGGPKSPWEKLTFQLPGGSVRVRFGCLPTTASLEHYCALDSIKVEVKGETLPVFKDKWPSSLPQPRQSV